VGRKEGGGKERFALETFESVLLTVFTPRLQNDEMQPVVLSLLLEPFICPCLI
jgi:hypothetical protein